MENRRRKAKYGRAVATQGGASEAPEVLARRFVNEIPVYELVGEERLDAIHDASMRILEDIGIEFRDALALDSWREAGEAGAAVPRRSRASPA